MRLAKFAGKFALFIAGMAFIVFISLFVVGAYLATWPIMRVSPRSRRLTSLMELATAAMGAARAYGLDKFTEPDENAPEPEPATDDTEATETHAGELAMFLNWLRKERGSFLTDADDLTQVEVESLSRQFLVRGGGE